MVRAALLLVVTFGLLFVPAPAGAQTPPCKIAVAARDLKAGKAPDFVGCPYTAAKKLLEASDYTASFVPAKPRPGVADDTIVRQVQLKGRYIFSVVGPAVAPVDPPTAEPAPTQPPPPPQLRRSIFSIKDAPAVQEGGMLAFPIVRIGNDGRSHRLILSYSDPAILDAPPDRIEISPMDSDPVLSLKTVATPSGDGDHRVRVTIKSWDDGGVVVEPVSAVGIITDTQPLPPPPAEASSYTVQLVGEAIRGDPIRFRISRTGALPGATVQYDIIHDGETLMRSDADQVVFAENETSRVVAITRDRYGVCSSSGGLALRDVPGTVTDAGWSFTDMPPRGCYPPPWWAPFVPPGDLSWIPPGIIIVGGGIPLGLYWRKRRRARLPEDDETPVDPEPDIPVASPPTIDVTSEIERGSWSFDPPDDAMGRWPGFETKVVIERGESAMPDPLPEGEMTDG